MDRIGSEEDVQVRLTEIYTIRSPFNHGKLNKGATEKTHSTNAPVQWFVIAATCICIQV